MNYAIAMQPTPIGQFLSDEPYEFYEPAGAYGRQAVARAISRSRDEYFDRVALTREHEAIEVAFTALAQRWLEATKFTSSLSEMTLHPTYQAIIALGAPVVPFLLRELDSHPAHWFMALRMITGDDPVPSNARGRLHAMAKAWLDWGKQHGLRW